MKFYYILLIVVFISIKATSSMAQCDYKIDITQKSSSKVGSITARLSNVGSYKYTLYAYEKGNKLTIEKKSGSSSVVTIKDLSKNRYYRLEFSFDDTKDILCSSWITDLIKFNK